jgi:hypothetical protein
MKRPSVDHAIDLNNASSSLQSSLADVSGTNAKSKFGTILADFTKINAGQNDSASLSIFASDITDFINLANAVASAASPASWLRGADLNR